MKIKTILIILSTPLLFFLISFLTLSDYGVSWDEPIHFHRGQAYLHYFLTGEISFKSLGERASYYQNNSLPAEYFFDNDSGHPPLNGILASLFNFIFYQKLGVLGDIEAYHLFNILVATLLVAVVVIFAWKTYGLFAGIISGIVISSYPLFFAEGHFNIKDPAESAFFGLTIWTFWMSLKNGSWKWLLSSVLSFSLALGTKFNILFLPFIVGPYLLIRYHQLTGSGWSSSISRLVRISRAYILVLALSPVIAIAIFFGTWPFLWQDPINNFAAIVSYYKGLGTGNTPGYLLPGGFNAYPMIWILTTTPPWVLLLASLGIIFTLKKGLGKDKVVILWLLWLLVPIIRVSLPNTVIYGGARQIMEFVPALGLISGLGGYALSRWFLSWNKDNKVAFLVKSIIVLGFLPHLFVMVKLHPNENVYFNSFIGGLPGAKEKNIPYWGNSFGNAYWQAIQWLNKNAEKGAKIALIQGTGLNIPKIKLRADLAYANWYWSGINREGEYLIELTHNDPTRLYPYAWDYVDKFLDPVYEVKVDGIAIAKIWKNDLSHTKPEMKLKEVNLQPDLEIKDGKITASLDEIELITRMVITWDNSFGCTSPTGGFYTSLDGQDWKREPEGWPLPYSQVPERDGEKPNTITLFFPAREAKFIEFSDQSSNSCVLKNPKVRVFVLK